MNEDGTVNSQVVDSVTGATTLVTGQAPSGAFGMMDAVLLESLGMAMHNAVMRQQGAGMTSNASVTAACAKMLGTPFPAPPPPPPPTPPTVHDVPSPPSGNSTSADINAAFHTADAAIKELQKASSTSGADAEAAKQKLKDLVNEASGDDTHEGSGDDTHEVSGDDTHEGSEDDTHEGSEDDTHEGSEDDTHDAADS